MTSNKVNYQQEISQMMYVLGEIRDPLDETTLLVEQITQNKMSELISQSLLQAQKRGSRFITAEDLIFLVRHNTEKVNRLRLFLSWKDVRKNVKEKEVSNGVLGGFDDTLVDDAGIEKEVKISQKMISFSWDNLYQWTSVLPDDEILPVEESAFEEQKNRLKKADNITKVMSRDEYIYYAECRQASFTFKKLKRFREWCDMQKVYEAKANSDVIDILGFFAYEIIRSLTETALELKKEWDAHGLAQDDETKPKLFARLHSDQTPLLQEHIQEAYRRLQKRQTKSSLRKNNKSGF